MTGRIDSLRSVGLFPEDRSAGIDRDILGEALGGSSLAFSGYAEFTPISVCSETTIKNADLERDKSRN